MKLILLFLSVIVCSESLSAEFRLEISLPESAGSDMTVISQELSTNKITELNELYSRIGLVSNCSAKKGKTICKIGSSYKNGSIRQGYPFFLYTSGSEVGLINLSDIKKVYGRATSVVFMESKYSLLSSTNNTIGEIDFDQIDDGSEYLLFTSKVSQSQVYFSSEVPSWMSNIIVETALRMKILYEKLAPDPEFDLFTYIHYSERTKENSWWGDVDSQGNMSLRFYGDAWKNYDKSAESSIIRFMAHEYFHRYYPYDADNEWAVEGAAEAFSTALLYKARYLSDSDFKSILKIKAIRCRESILKNEDSSNKYVNRDFSYNCGFFAFFTYPSLPSENEKSLGASIDPASPLEVLDIFEADSNRLIRSSHWGRVNESLKIRTLERIFEGSRDPLILDEFFELINLDLLDSY